MSSVRTFVAALAFLALVSSLEGAPSAEGASALQDEDWTIMLYMAADAYPELYWEADINEMESADLPDSVHVVALVDPLGTGDSRIYEIAHDPEYLDPAIYSPEIDDGGQVIIGGEVNTGSPDTIGSFIEFAVGHYPADRYALVLWGHGGGWMGLCPDGADILTLPELRSALEEAETTTGAGIDLLAVDACVEGTLETVYELRKCADFFVASEKTVPGEGYPYDLVLGDLADEPDMTPDELGATIVDRFAEWAAYGSDYSETMTMYDLSMVDGLMSALDGLASECVKFNELFDEELYGALWDSESYEDPDSVDLGDLLQELARDDLPIELRYSAFEAFLAYSGVIGRFGTSVLTDPEDGITIDDATGMVAYIPGNYSYPDYDDLLAADTSWPSMARALWDDLDPVQPGEDLVLDATDPDDDGWDDGVESWWSEGADATDLWVFRQDYDGVSLVGHIALDGAYAGMDGLHGLVIVSVSSLDAAGTATAHEEVSMEFAWEAVVEVAVTDPSGGSTEGLVAYAVLDDGEEVAAEDGGPLTISLGIPDEVNYGQMVRVELRDAEGEVVGWNFAVIASDLTTCEVVVTSGDDVDDGPEAYEVVLAVAAWAAAAVAVAYALVRWRRGG